MLDAAAGTTQYANRPLRRTPEPACAVGKDVTAAPARRRPQNEPQADYDRRLLDKTNFVVVLSMNDIGLYTGGSASDGSGGRHDRRWNVELTGEGLLALWNGVEPTVRHEYDAWHSREHVPERLSVPGMIGARRYVRRQGPLPEYLTLYAMRDTGVMESAPYRRLLENPTPWSRRMRPHFHGFMRICCRRLASFGAGTGSVLAAVVVDESVDLVSPALHAALRGLLSHEAFLAAHVAKRDAGVPDVPFSIGGEPLDFPGAGAIFVESYAESALARGRPALLSALVAAGFNAPERTLTTYALANALDAASLARVVTIGLDVLSAEV